MAKLVTATITFILQEGLEDMQKFLIDKWFVQCLEAEHTGVAEHNSTNVIEFEVDDMENGDVR